jgi:CubicO group peptidase (beta-lactamase class C family)
MAFSVTKGVLATLAHVLVDQGVLEYDRPVAHYWPGFQQSGKDTLTLRHVLCHESGLYGVRDLIDDANALMDWDYMIQKLTRAAPLHQPGKTHAYHAVTYGYLLGHIIELATGKSIPELVATLLAQPLDEPGLAFGRDQVDLANCSDLVMRSGHLFPFERQSVRRRVLFKLLQSSFMLTPASFEDFDQAFWLRGMEHVQLNDPTWGAAPIWSANGFFSANALAKLFGVMASGEEMGCKLLTPETWGVATQVQNTALGRVSPVPLHWRLGYHRTFGSLQLRNAFGHWGLGGSSAWVDPKRQLSVAFVTNRTEFSAFAQLVALNRLLVKCADQRGAASEISSKVIGF